MSSEVDDAIEQLQELESDANIPKNIKIRLKSIMDILGHEGEDSIKTNKALNELDEISNDPNLDPFIRTQIWNIVSMLEKISH